MRNNVPQKEKRRSRYAASKCKWAIVRKKGRKTRGATAEGRREKQSEILETLCSNTSTKESDSAAISAFFSSSKYVRNENLTHPKSAHSETFHQSTYRARLKKGGYSVTLGYLYGPVFKQEPIRSGGRTWADENGANGRYELDSKSTRFVLYWLLLAPRRPQLSRPVRPCYVVPPPPQPRPPPSSSPSSSCLLCNNQEAALHVCAVHV